VGPDRTRQARRRFLQGSLALAGLGVLSGCGIIPSRAEQSARVPRIGFLWGGSEATYPAASHEAFRSALGQLGYIEGRNIVFESRFAGGRPERLPELTTELVQQNVDVIVAAGTPQVQAAQRATSTIPIVMAYAGDPVASGLVASLARPGGNITGLTTLGPELAPKRLQLLKEISPGISRVGVLYQAYDPGRVLAFRETEAAARALGIQIQALEVLENQVTAPLAAAIGEQLDALIVLAGDQSLIGQRPAIVGFAAQQRLPAMYEAREWTVAGGLMAYGVNFEDLYRRAATYVDKILKGANPAALPVERPTTFDFIVNLKTARELGLTLTQSFLQQATELIQ
jgi:ABC-type uncharacterized transport system substrate-binding protein